MCLMQFAGTPFLNATAWNWETTEWYRENAKRTEVWVIYPSTTFPAIDEISVTNTFMIFPSALAQWNRYEIDKVTAGQRLDLNLEKGWDKLIVNLMYHNKIIILFMLFPLLTIIAYRRIRDELANQTAETNNLTNKLDRVSWVSSSIYIFLSSFELNTLLLFTGNSCIKSPIGSSKIRCNQILHRYPCLNICSWTCCHPHFNVRLMFADAI